MFNFNEEIDVNAVNQLFLPQENLDSSEKDFKKQNIFQDLLESIEEEEKVAFEDVKYEDEIKERQRMEYYVKRCKQAQLQIENNKEIANDYLKTVKEKIDRWLKRVNGEQEFIINYYTPALQDFAKKELEGSKKKSVKLIEGTLSFTGGGNEFSYEDEEVLNFLEANNIDKFIRIKKSVDKASLKKEGEVKEVTDGNTGIKEKKLFVNDVAIDGVSIADKEITFKIK